MDVANMTEHELHLLARNHNSPFAQDDALMVTFSQNAVQDTVETEKQGRPIYKDVDWICIRFPGSRDTIERKVRSDDKTRWPKQWAAYQSNKSQEAVSGTPLSAWPAVTRAQVEEFAFFGVKTVEQLAEMPDPALQKFMGGQTLKQRARDFIEAAKGEAPMVAMRAEIENLKAQVAAQAAAAAAAANAEKSKK